MVPMGPTARRGPMIGGAGGDEFIVVRPASSSIHPRLPVRVTGEAPAPASMDPSHRSGLLGFCGPPCLPTSSCPRSARSLTGWDSSPAVDEGRWVWSAAAVAVVAVVSHCCKGCLSASWLLHTQTIPSTLTRLLHSPNLASPSVLGSSMTHRVPGHTLSLS
ncbi:hypothetical protein BO70DRAFT_52461 [Aspergillus heteromorphus CBS 117.55]|uniref:Uncharacterized protein n=1 Tax=Aspergillus heteromorphus CBS 117.55 TaxID=1448321 RepID=A0A317W2Z8_9EURO|nr:uncharacterized protein BO70DRAFT_52461 [Aspergillus heteromorphus CBS 117.55]PWY79652.1 hypothetical protein BO70DRAFT_52461 [Aspergillus heteromorphus CBS 117.55]